MADNTPTGMKAGADVYVIDPDGSTPATISSVVLSGPGDFSYTFVAGDYYGANEYWHAFDGLPADGAARAQQRHARPAVPGPAVPLPCRCHLAHQRDDEDRRGRGREQE